MLYIHDSKQPYVTYDNAVAFAVKHGVDPKRVYLYLMALGVKGAKGRVMSDSGTDYLAATKLAVKDDKVVADIFVCDHCKSLAVK